MSDMYEKVSRPERPAPPGAGDSPRHCSGSGCLGHRSVVAVRLWRFVGVRPKFYQFVSALSDSTIYAYDNHTLRAEGNGQSVRVSGDNAYAIYRGMSAWSPTGLPRRLPAGEADLALDYGEGTCLQVWIWKEKNGRQRLMAFPSYWKQGQGNGLCWNLVRPASAGWSGGLRRCHWKRTMGDSRETSEAQSRRARQQSFRHSWLNRRRKGRTPGGRWPDIIWPVRAPRSAVPADSDGSTQSAVHPCGVVPKARATSTQTCLLPKASHRGSSWSRRRI